MTEKILTTEAIQAPKAEASREGSVKWRIGLIAALVAAGCGDNVNPPQGADFCLGGPCLGSAFNPDGGVGGTSGTGGVDGGIGGKGGASGVGGNAGTGGLDGGAGTGGASGTTTCLPHETVCDGVCVNTFTDKENCGDCGVICNDFIENSICLDGNCGCYPNVGLLNCEGICVKFLEDEQNCGGCDEKCSTNKTCINGNCV